ncbi:hypothetical protein [Streptomyces sp. bgisy082]|uniref:hypothetical protein n=1 Tax=Streptomyces sp. bgisy082 TaxID=3413776 RepID=UPI003D73D3E4
MAVTNGTKKKVSSTSTTTVGRSAAESATSDPLPSRFGIAHAHALVLVAFLAAAVILRLAAKMDVNDIGILLCWAGAIGVIVVLATNTGSRGPGAPRRLLGRVLAAVFSGPTQ